MRHSPIVTLRCCAVVVLAAVACQTKTAPQKLRLELPELITSGDPVKVVVRVTDAQGMVTTADGEHPFVITPAGLASAGSRGSLHCTRSGDGSVELTWGTASDRAKLRCRLVDKLDTSLAHQQRVELADGAFTPKVRVLGKDGVELADVELAFSSKTPGVLFPKGKQLVPNNVGTAVVVARADQVAREFSVDVVRKLAPEALPLDGNRRIHFSLLPGKYQLVVELPEPKALAAEWRGAPHCAYTAIQRRHVSTCVLRTKGGVAFPNPAFLLRSASELSLEGVSLHEVP